MSSRHNDILQDDDEFTSLATTSPNDHNYQFYYHQPGSLYNGLGYGALFTLDNANLYSNQRGGAAINNLGKIRDNFSFDRAADQLTRPGLTHNGDQVYHQPVALTYSFLTQSALNRIGQTGDGDKGLQPLTQAAQAQALKSMQAWADVANVTFTEAASTDIHHRADITFAYFTQRADGSAAAGSGPNAINAYAYYPPSSKPGSDNAFAGTVWFNKDYVMVTKSRYPRACGVLVSIFMSALCHLRDYAGPPGRAPRVRLNDRSGWLGVPFVGRPRGHTGGMTKALTVI
ncbi:TPA: hypothetical protein ACYSHR_004728 [Serratia marcescens]